MQKTTSKQLFQYYLKCMNNRPARCNKKDTKPRFLQLHEAELRPQSRFTSNKTSSLSLSDVYSDLKK